MKKSYVGMLLVLLLIFPLVSAYTIDDTIITIKVSNRTIVNENGTILNIEVINSEYISNNKNFTIVVNNGSKVYNSFDFAFVFIKNESVGSDIVSKYVDCLTAKSTCELTKSQFNTAWDNCLKDLQEINNQNLTNCSSSLQNWILKSKEKDLTIGSKDEEINKLETEKESTKNNKFIGFGIGCLLGALGALAYHGKIGIKAQDKSTTEFNRNQAG